MYESKICLASRIVKVERQVDDIESKLDQLIDLYMEDRKRLLALPPPGSAPFPATPTSAPLPGSPDSCNSGPATSFTQVCSASSAIPSSSLTVPGAPPPYVSVLKPKPILVDKQASEPNTPTNKYFERPMTRGNSDVSQRMKKRVTLSSLPSRHSLEAKEPDLLQVPQVVQIEHTAAPYIEEDCDPSNQDDDCSTIMTYDYESLEPATIEEENEFSSITIPTISASVAQDTTSLQVPAPTIISHPHHSSSLYHHHPAELNHHYQTSHHTGYHTHYPYTYHHYPRHHYSHHLPTHHESRVSISPPTSSPSSSYALLPVLEPPVLVGESIELHATETSQLLPAPEIVTMEESSS